MKALWQVVQDLEHASRKGQLTPSFVETYADKHGERVSALYALAAKNMLAIDHEAGRNDHILRSPEEDRPVRQGTVNAAAVAAAAEDTSREMHRELRRARDDGRPYALRKPSKNAFFIVKDR
ncbi:hypothetical protein [Kineococcus sp. SYSU DK004]|uniref:hypothetical protein n=1 Tax=Kineococcus sp. SYSU DK004 TaxID=3383125 RepID=UPI003D7E7154